MLKKAVRAATLSLKAVPVLMGSSFKNKAVQNLLDAVVDYLPSPADKADVSGTDPKSGQQAEPQTLRQRADVGPGLQDHERSLRGAADLFPGLFRRASRSAATVLNSRRGQKLRVAKLLKMHANKREEVDAVHSGDIAATVGLEGRRHRRHAVRRAASHPARYHPVPRTGRPGHHRTAPDLGASEAGRGPGQTGQRRSDPEILRRSPTPARRSSPAWASCTWRSSRNGSSASSRSRPSSASRAWPIMRPCARRPAARKNTSSSRAARASTAMSCWRSSPTDGDGKFKFTVKIKPGIIPKEFLPAIEQGVPEAMDIGVIAGFPDHPCRGRAAGWLVPRRGFHRAGLQDRGLAWPSRPPFARATRSCSSRS